MTKKRVLIFSLAYFPKHVGGAEIAIKEITDRIPDIEFHMVTNRFDSSLPKTEQIGNVFVHRIGLTKRSPSMADLRRWPLHLNKVLYQFLAVYTALRLHRRYRYDAVWAMMAHSCGVPAALFKLFHQNVPYILTLQEGDPIPQIEHTMLPLWPLFSRAFTSADVVQAISTYLGEWARNRGFKGKLEVIPNGVDMARFSKFYSAEVLAEARRALGKHDGDVFLVTASRLVPKNAVDDIIRALPLLPKRISLVVFGDGAQRESLGALVGELGLEGRVHFRGSVSHEHLPFYLKSCDIFIRPSRSEGMGNAFVEAMAAELPVIATQEGGIADFLFDERRNPEKRTTGWAVDKDSPEQIAEAVGRILGDPVQTAHVTAQAKSMVAEHYDWNVIAESMRRRIFGLV